MKNKLAVLSLLSLSVACGDGLVDHSKVTSAVTAEKPVVASGAEAVFDAEEASGCPGVWSDSSGNSNDLDIACGAGGPTGAGTAADPKRVRFDGSATVVTANSYSPQPTGESTWVVWYRTNVTTSTALMSLGDFSDFNRSIVFDTTYKLHTGSSFATGLPVTTSQWTFVATTFGSSSTAITVNGSKVTNSVAPTDPTNSDLLTLGRSAGASTEYLSGDIAWVAVYPRVLTDKEIKDTCLALKDRFSGASCD